jgi:hypothetical protein
MLFHWQTNSPRTCAYYNAKRNFVGRQHLLARADPCTLQDKLVARQHFGLAGMWADRHWPVEQPTANADRQIICAVLLLGLLLLLQGAQPAQAVCAGLPCGKLPGVLCRGRTQLLCARRWGTAKPAMQQTTQDQAQLSTKQTQPALRSAAAVQDDGAA